MKDRKYNISQVYLEGDWSPLLSRLPDWEKVPTWKRGPSLWTDGTSIIDDQSGLFSVCMGEQDISGEKHIHHYIKTAPSGFFFGIDTGIPDQEKLPYKMNHFAYYAEDLEMEAEWMRIFLGHEPVLNVEQEYDPILQGPLDAVHFYDPLNYYVTIRRQDPRGELHHFGWETVDLETITEAREILAEINWPIAWEGDIDGSYVVHFKGPDNRIHDFFYVSEDLKEQARSVMRGKDE
jgi:hypothetical protein